MKLPNCNLCGRANAYYPLSAKPECRNSSCVNYNQSWAATCECCYTNPCKKPVEPPVEPCDGKTVEPQHNSNDMDSWWRGQLQPYVLEYAVDNWTDSHGQLHGKTVVRNNRAVRFKKGYVAGVVRVKDTGEVVYNHQVDDVLAVMKDIQEMDAAWEADNS